MTWLECVCGHALAGERDFAYSSHFFSAADWQEAGEQILEAMGRLLAAAHDSADGDDTEDMDDVIGAVYACERCGRRWLRLPDGPRA